MTTMNVVVTSNINQECWEIMNRVSPELKIIDASELLRAELKGIPGSREKLDGLLSTAEIVYGLRLPKDLLRRAPSLKWVQLMAAGVDRYLDDEFRRLPVLLTNVSGIHAIAISELVVGEMLMFAKQIPACFQLKQARQWTHLSPVRLRSKTVGIVGLGNIGLEVARLSKAFGLKVLATRRSATGVGKARYVDVLLAPEYLPRLLAESDFVVLSLPLIPGTQRLIGEKELRSMKPTSFLINISRGQIVDEKALVRALEEKWIAGAGLDVFETEPLPADSRIWDLPNVIFTPHIAGAMEDYALEATRIFAENLGRYLTGKKLLNLVDKQKGY
jgi:D-2-hydroxyacid dehydrogenase (NADP+)